MFATVFTCGFACLICVMASAGRMSWLVPAYYAALAVVAFIAYAVDKSAAIDNRRRVPERHLHLLSMVGGWPGALAAQRMLRHKTRKRPFQAIYLASVVLNCAALAWLISAYRI